MFQVFFGAYLKDDLLQTRARKTKERKIKQSKPNEINQIIGKVQNYLGNH
tara:strand:- start:347 stop:496 length:150 start_codon:yes stop_codon:yes gene_type:complete